MTAPEPPSLDEIQHRVSVAIGRASYSLPPPQLLPMIHNERTEKLCKYFLLFDKFPD
jgi:hypothetical protein